MMVTWIIVCCAVVTFFWRALGAVIAGRVRAHSPVFNAASCITYAMVGALVIKLILYPQGVAADTALIYRLLAVAGALAVYGISRNTAVAAWCGSGVLLLFIY